MLRKSTLRTITQPKMAMETVIMPKRESILRIITQPKMAIQMVIMLKRESILRIITPKKVGIHRKFIPGKTMKHRIIMDLQVL